jgi:putative DNA primase/helicase
MKTKRYSANATRMPEDGLDSAPASAFEMEAFDWLWPNRFALGKVGLAVGLPDEGKGQLLCYLAAQVTTGGPWPCDEGIAPQGNVLLFTAEDDIKDTVAPRLAAAGADLSRVHIVKMVRSQSMLNGRQPRMFNLATDLDLLKKKILEIGDVRLVEIDPISAYLGVGKVDSFRTTDVRAVLAPLVDLAAELKVAIVAVMHFNKKIDITNVMLRISDSLAFAAVARHVYGVVDDAEHERKLLVRAKNNVAIKTKNQTLAFRFEACEVGIDKRSGRRIWAPHIVFEDDYVDVSAMEAMQAVASNKAPTARDGAKKFLFDLLAHGPVLSAEIEEAAEANGVSRRTLFRAKNDLNVIAKKDTTKKNGPWTWQLPDDLTVKSSKLN